MVKACEGEPEVFAWLLCDHKALRNYGLGCVAPAPLPIGRHLRSGYLKRGATVAELARADRRRRPQRWKRPSPSSTPTQSRAKTLHSAKAAKPTTATKATRWSRRTRASLRWRRAPYYAIKLVIGDIGTFAGLVTDENTRVLDAAGKPIKGLYAVGNDAASVMGGNYPGAGITLGPALTFGYVAAMHLAKATATAQATLKIEQPEPVAVHRHA